LEQKKEVLIDAVRQYERYQNRFDAHEIRKNAERFSKHRFKQAFAAFVESKLAADRA